MDTTAAVKAVAGDIVRTVALAAWRQSPIRLESEAARLALRHPAAHIAAYEVREYLVRVAGAQRVAVVSA